MNKKYVKAGQYTALGLTVLGTCSSAMADGTSALGIDFSSASTTVLAVGALAVTAALAPFGAKMAIIFGKGVFKVLFR